MNYGGIVLCGGRSSRMGLPKVALPFGPELLLQRVVRLLGQVLEEIVVVAAPGQELPELPARVRIARDRREGRGPLEGLCAGWSRLPESIDAAYATGCDVPLLVPGFVVRMLELLGDHAIAVPVSDGRYHPLAAVYRRSVVPSMERLLAADQLRPALLFQSCSTRLVTAAELADVDPELATLMNLNDLADYLAALARTGFAPPPGILGKVADHRTEGSRRRPRD